MFFQEGEYQPDQIKSAEWNRGAYLVEGLGHCAMCHSPTNALGGSVVQEPTAVNDGNVILATGNTWARLSTDDGLTAMPWPASPGNGP